MFKSPLEVCIIAMTMQALVTGAYLTSFLMCLRWLVLSDDGGSLRKRINWPIFIITVVLFSLCVTELSISLHVTLLISEGHGIGNPYATTIADFIELFSPIITDGVLIFRCWTVWNKRWGIAVLPILLLLYNVSCLLILTYCNFGNRPGSLRANQLEGIKGSYYASTIAINIYATSAIIWQIWRNSLSRRLCRFAIPIRVIAESGLLYTLTSIATFCAVLLSPHEWFMVVTAINFPTSLIAYNLILIRVAQNRAKPKPELPAFIHNDAIELLFRPQSHGPTLPDGQGSENSPNVVQQTSC
ncbi:hypothetical protein F5887DRAFT_999715 [Amanita rubescens]|nr:hypothetical protein F5887DRAFT_999715 [Amanita rubescens]